MIKRTLIVLFIVFSVKCFAQKKRANIWYFGKYAGIDFTSTTPSALLNSAMTNLEGTSSISDTAGSLLFYTNGVDVWNNSHSTMPNGTGLTGNSSTAQTLIIPKPKSNSSFYIFYADAYGGPNGLRYSEVDMLLNSGSGDVVSSTKNTLLHLNASEKIAAVNHCNGTDVWVMTINYSTDQFFAYLVTPSGIMPPVISNCMPDDGECCNSIKFSPDGKWLAYTNNLTTGGDDSQLFTFNNQTGGATFKCTLPRNISIDESLWGLSFSPGNSKLYISSAYSNQTVGVFTRLYQYDLTASNIPNSKIEVLQGVFTNSSTNLYFFSQLQNAPNGKIYLARWGMWLDIDTLGVINSPDLPGLSCNALISGLPLSGRGSLIGLPNYNESYFNISPNTNTPIPVSLAVTGDFSLCAGNSVTLSASGANTYFWNNLITGSTIVVSPTVTSNYTLQGLASTCGYADTVITVTVISSPVLSTNNVTVCAGNSVILSATVTPVSGISYLWQPTGATNSSINITPSQTTHFTVTASHNDCGFSQSNIIDVNVISEPVLSVNSVTVCPGESVVLLASVNPSTNISYLWQPGGTTSSSLSVNVSQSTQYTLTASHNICGFTQSDIATVTIKDLIAPTTDFYYKPVCINDTILKPQLSENFTSGGNFISSSSLPINMTSGSIDLTASYSGTYIITYSLDANKCTAAGTNTAIVEIEDIKLTYQTEVRIAPGESALLSISGASHYSWSYEPGMSCNDCPNPIVTPEKNTSYCFLAETDHCKSRACINVIVGCDNGGDFSVPNAFTPNDDGENDMFCLRGWDFCIKQFSVLIFDRWGEKVFESTNPNFCWDGIYKGQTLATDVFVYVIKATYTNNSERTKKGNITLIR